MAELKPCPFCGGKAKMFATYPEAHFRKVVWDIKVYCMKCNIALPNSNYRVEAQLDADGAVEIIKDDRPLAIEAWNRRADNG